MSFCHGHADSHAQAGAEGACRRFDARRVTVFRMTRCQGAVLTELFNVVHGQAVAVEMEQRIQQHRAVASREDKAVAVRPFRVLCVMVHVICPEFVCNGAAPRGRPGWPELAFWMASADNTRMAFTQVVSMVLISQIAPFYVIENK